MHPGRTGDPNPDASSVHSGYAGYAGHPGYSSGNSVHPDASVQPGYAEHS